ncbi:hypothetical protein LJC59_04075 [Desulfovibrio sp. OttesenSCG-928-A18]|nr:hypothetical protein [Desulfovibrio sp. OttesenSCG-928-A18]
MEQAELGFNWAVLAIPALLAFIPLFLFIAGYRASRSQLQSFAGKSLYWMGGHGVTLVIVAALTELRGAFIPDMVVTQLPLLITASYLLLGLFRRLPYLFTLGLATPGLWILCLKSWEAFYGAPYTLYRLPQDPFWYLLAAVIIFGMRYLSKPRSFWEECESSLVTISAGYFMGGLWMLALANESLLGALGLVQYVWAAILFVVSAFLLWCSNYLKDPLFAGCSVIGLAAGVYTFISYYPW